MLKRFVTRSAVLVLPMCFAIGGSACSSSNPGTPNTKQPTSSGLCTADATKAGADVLCFQVDGAAADTLTADSSVATPYGGDPALMATYQTAPDNTFIAAGKGYTSYLDQPPFSEVINIQTPGSGTGSFDVTAAAQSFAFMKDGKTYGAGSGVSGSSGQVKITTYGDVGGRIIGTFDIHACLDSGSGADCSQGKVEVVGAFDITREADDWHNTCVADATAAGGDTVCYAVNGALLSFVEAPSTDSSNPYGDDPLAMASYDPRDQTTFLAAGAQFTSTGDNPPFQRSLSFLVAGNQPGTYTIGDSTNTLVSFDLSSATASYGARSDTTANTGSGSVTITSFGAVGGHIRGTFDVHLCLTSPTAAPDCNNGPEVKGAFDVTREADGLIPECMGLDATALGGDSVCYSTDDGATTHTVTEAPASNPYGGDPVLAAFYSTSDDTTSIGMGKGYSSFVNQPPFAESLNVQLSGNGVGTYDAADGTVQEIDFNTGGKTYVLSTRPSNPIPATNPDGWVEVGQWDGPGGRARLNVNANLCLASSAGAPDCSNQVHVRATFDVTIESDDWHMSCTADHTVTGADTLCFTANGALVQDVEQSSSANPVGFDPAVVAFLDPTQGGLQIFGAAHYTSMSAQPPFADTVGINLGANTSGNPDLTGTYTMGDATMPVNGIALQYGGKSFGASSATVIITDDGASGGYVTGTFTAEMCPDTGSGPDCTNGGGFTINGAFDSQREPDGWIGECGTLDTSGGNAMCYSKDNGGPNPVLESPDASNPYGGDPAVAGLEAYGAAVVMEGQGFTSFMDSPPFSQSMMVQTIPTPGSYDITAGDASIDFTQNGQHYEAKQSVTGSSGWVTVETWDGPGGNGVVHFDARLCLDGPTGVDCSAGNQIHLRGTYNVTIKPTDWHLGCSVTGATSDAMCLLNQVGVEQIVAQSAQNAFGFDPVLVAYYQPAAGKFQIAMAESFLSGSSQPFFSRMFNIELGSNAAGTYTLTNTTTPLNGATLEWDGAKFTTVPTSQTHTDTSQVILTSVGSSGSGRVQGTFSLDLCREDSTGTPDCSGNNATTVSGEFDIARQVDGFVPECANIDALASAASADAVCYSVSDNSGNGGNMTMHRVTEQLDATNPFGGDPVAVTSVNSTGGIFFGMGDGYLNVVPQPSFGESLSFQVQGSSSGTYILNGTSSSLTQMNYTAAGGSAAPQMYVAGLDTSQTPAVRYGGGSVVVLDPMPTVGGIMKGYFTLTLCSQVSGSAPDCGTWVQVRGAFDVTREADDWHQNCTVPSTATDPDALCYTLNGALVNKVEPASPDPTTDPVFAAPLSSTGTTTISMSQYADSSVSPAYDEILSFDLPSGTPVPANTYTPSAVTYRRNGLDYVVDGSGNLSPGTVTISQYDGVAGGHAGGSYDLNLCRLDYTLTPPASNCNDRVNLRGAFWITLQ